MCFQLTGSSVNLKGYAISIVEYEQHFINFISSEVNRKNCIDVVCDFSACNDVTLETLCVKYGTLMLVIQINLRSNGGVGVTMASPFLMCVERKD